MPGQSLCRPGAVLTGQRPPRPAPGTEDSPEPPGVTQVDALPPPHQKPLTVCCPRAGTPVRGSADPHHAGPAVPAAVLRPRSSFTPVVHGSRRPDARSYPPTALNAADPDVARSSGFNGGAICPSLRARHSDGVHLAWAGRGSGDAGRLSLDGTEPGGARHQDYLLTANSKYSLTRATWRGNARLLA